MTTMATKHHMKHCTDSRTTTPEMDFSKHIAKDFPTHIHRDQLRHTHTPMRGISLHKYSYTESDGLHYKYAHIYSQSDGHRYIHIYLQVMDFAIHTHIHSDGLCCTLIHSDAMDFAAHTHTQGMDFARHTLIQKRWTSLHIHTHTILWNGWRWTSPWLHR
ncbi:hypothetical protein BDD12DRAFT_529053 [Trichophaea hybrida]|nr:hypothetical protein BDD12DRAFT_529053 [Trichophaea hybrida]